MPLSFNPATQQKVSMWEGGPATINAIRAVIWDYNGQQKEGPFLHVNLTAHEDSKEHDEYYGAGAIEAFVPSEDGLTLEPQKKGRTGLNDDCNASHLMNSIVGAGFDPEVIGEDLSVFDDMDVTFARQTINRVIKGQAQQSNPLLVSSIERMPGEKKTAAAKGKPATAAKGTMVPAKGAAKPAPGKAPAAKANAIAEAAEEAVGGVVVEAGEAITKKKLSIKLMGALKGNPDLKKILEQVNDAEWLYSADRPWGSDADAETIG